MGYIIHLQSDVRLLNQLYETDIRSNNEEHIKISMLNFTFQDNVTKSYTLNASERVVDCRHIVLDEVCKLFCIT